MLGERARGKLAIGHDHGLAVHVGDGETAVHVQLQVMSVRRAKPTNSAMKLPMSTSGRAIWGERLDILYI